MDKRIKHIYKLILKENYILVDYLSYINMFRLEKETEKEKRTNHVYEYGEFVIFKAFNSGIETISYFDLT